MAIYDTGTASLAANGQVNGVGTQWTMPLTLIRVGATIVFKTDPVQIYTISEINSDTSLSVYNPNGETAPVGTGYAILAHDGISVQGLAQDVAETLRYYQSQETYVAQAVDAFSNFDSNDFESKVDQVNNQHIDVVSIGAQVAADAAQVSSDKDSAAASAASALADKNAAALSAAEAADSAASLNTDNLLKKSDNLSDLADNGAARDNLSVYSKQDINSRLSTRIDVVKDFGADPTGVSDSAQAFQSAFDYASDVSGVNGHGVAIYVPGGNYSIGSQITYTWRSSLDNSVVNDGDTRRISIIGDGASNTFINDVRIAPGPVPLIDIAGGNPLPPFNNDPHLRFYAYGLRIQRRDQDRSSWGLRVNGCAVLKLEQVDIQWFDVGMVLRDLIQAYFSHMQIGACSLGVSLERSEWTNPNVIKFEHVMFGGNNSGCININDGANIKFDTCSFEGTVTPNRESTYCINYTGAPSEGGSGITIDNCYFENNNVKSDVRISNMTTSSVGVHTIRNNSFQRTSSTSYCINHVEIVNTIGKPGRFIVNLTGNAFKAFGHPHVAGNNSVAVGGAWAEVVDSGNVYEIEQPNYAGLTGGANGYSNAIICAGKVASSGVSVGGGYNIGSVERLGAGDYRINFVKPPSSPDYFPVVTLQDANGHSFTATLSSGSFRVVTSDVNGTATDSSFNFIVAGIK